MFLRSRELTQSGDRDIWSIRKKPLLFLGYIWSRVHYFLKDKTPHR